MHTDLRMSIAAFLRERNEEIHQEIFNHIRNVVPDPVGDKSLEYTTGLDRAVAGGLTYSLLALEHEGIPPELIPAALVEQARRAARNGVNMETMLRRMVLAERIIKRFSAKAIQGVPPDILDDVLSALSSAVDHLMVVLADEYNQELLELGFSPEQRRIRVVQRLLVDEAVEPAELETLKYKFDDKWHVSIIATGATSRDSTPLRRMRLASELLHIMRDEQTVWVWLGNRQRYVSEMDAKQIASKMSLTLSVGLGEPGYGLEGWRLSHSQAQEAIPVARLKPRQALRYADVALLIPWLHDRHRAQSLVELYLSGLNAQGDGGETYRKTLRTYFATGYCIKTTAATLKVDRSTVRRRIKSIELAVGCPLPVRQAELDVAMRLDELNKAAQSVDAASKDSGATSGRSRAGGVSSPG
jgi:hypothetical protein